MFEAVGESYWPSYFELIKRSLKPGGRAVIQTITIAEEKFERYRSSTDFIQQYIFPGGMLPAVSVFKAIAADQGLLTASTNFFGDDYAETLQRWHEQFLHVIPQLNDFDLRFIRTWRFYLAYCEAGFRTRATNVMHAVLRHA
jgi:cyclopropane-fatty-acyl-phospholipid synthase